MASGTNGMIWKIYFIILSYFVLGVICFFFINRKKERTEAHKSWIKLFFYFIIIQILFFSIVIDSHAFRALAILIIIVGFYEIYKLFRESGYTFKGVYLSSVFFYVIFAIGFFVFSGMKKELILFSFMILSIFDSFSQVTGQLWGRKKIAPKISPQKTFEGFIGGAVIAILSSFLLNNLVSVSFFKTMVLTVGIVAFAFIGDISASFYKRQFKVKDFSRLIPQHGGFLDRFDSLIAGGAWVALLGQIMNFQ